MLGYGHELASAPAQEFSLCFVAGRTAGEANRVIVPPDVESTEDQMRKTGTIVLAVVLVMGMGGLSFAYETDFDDLQRFDRSLRWWKFGRGIVNIVTAPAEIFSNMNNYAINGAYYGAYDGSLQGYVAGATNGFIAGSLVGVKRSLQRATTGALEVLTFWKPEYGPTMEPLYGTRSRLWQEHDYFNPNPFWYIGPPR